MKAAQMIDIMRAHTIESDYLVAVLDTEDDRLHFEHMGYDAEYDIFEWYNDWYEGQPYDILGYIPYSDLSISLVEDHKHNEQKEIWGWLIS